MVVPLRTGGSVFHSISLMFTIQAVSLSGLEA